MSLFSLIGCNKNQFVPKSPSSRLSPHLKVAKTDTPLSFGHQVEQPLPNFASYAAVSPPLEIISNNDSVVMKPLAKKQICRFLPPF